ncbi:LacI family DNA-binding transcriptional regulator [Rubritalea marina]|uniref:LacI family DNA-binding transcriptional regulator n=1 Tax=Rubritalea marina TaxID=361055 RepID=UPI0003613E0D|nr:LacI family DNA-binding transcriptional regulator [Rubritalea marina]
MKQLAEICGYSRVTVSAALNGKSGVSDRVREEILAKAKEHNYTPNKMAAALKGERSYLIGMLVRDISNPFFSQMIKVIDEVVSSSGYSLLLLNTNEDPKREDAAIKTLFSYNIDGLLLSPFIREDNSYKLLDYFIQKEIPVIMLDRLPADLKLGYIGFRNRQGAHDATEHLYQKGHRKISYLAGPDISIASKERGEGFLRCLREHGLEETDQSLVACGSSSENGYAAGLELLRDAQTRPTAILCFNDLVAIGLYRAALELELKIPQDISIVGFDNIDLTEILAPPLTTMSLEINHVSEQAARKLLSCIENQESPESLQKVFYPKLVERQSVASPPQA